MKPWTIDEGVPDGELVLHLHGGFSESSVVHGVLLPKLGDRHRVAGFDRRGHGKTPDTDAPFHYCSMAARARRTSSATATVAASPSGSPRSA